MNNNPYSPPKANLETENQHKHSLVKAVIVASTVDIVGTIVLSILLGILYSLFLSSNGASQEEIAAILQTIEKSSFIGLTGAILGSLITVFSGYLCAKISNCLSYKPITIYALIVIFISSLFDGGYYDSSTERIVYQILTLLTAFAGGWIYISKNRSIPSESPQ